MMEEHLQALRQRRSVLLVRAEDEREALATVLAHTDTASAWLSGALSLADRVRRHPALLAGAVALVVALRPKTAFKWAVRAWSAWRLVRAAL